MSLASINYRRATDFLGSKSFFRGVVALFCLQAAWIALTARYPQAFDEQFHFGVIQIYSHQLSPFLTHQPPHTGQYGALAVDPSYLYHYLMSFPYRLIRLFTADQPAQIIALRFINAAMFAWGLVVFRKVFRAVKLPAALSNVILLCFVMLPVVPLLGAHINYDNLTIPLSGLAVLWTLQLLQGLKAHRLPLSKLLSLLVLCLLGSLVKYEFLAVVLGVVIVLGWAAFGAIKEDKAQFFGQIKARLRVLRRWHLAAGALIIIASSGLFAQRYVGNVLAYHRVVPQCNQVLSLSECMENGPFARTYKNHNDKPPLSLERKLLYPLPWFRETMKELTFAISSSFGSNGVTVIYYTQNPLPVLLGLVWFISLSGLLLIIAHLRRLWREPTWRSFIIISLVYVAILFVKNYQSFLEEREVVAVHSRYLFPVLLLFAALAAQSLQWFLTEHLQFRWVRPAKVWLVAATFLLFIEGGGLLTWVARSNPSWFWPESRPAQRVNAVAQEITKPFIWTG